MKVYRLTEIILETPVTIIARDKAHAADMVVMALRNAFGQLPEVLYSIDEWLTYVSSDRKARAAADLAEVGHPGFVQEHERFWDTHDPFDDW